MGPAAPIVTCSRADSLHRALTLFAAAGGLCERLVCVDELGRCTGVVTLSDVFRYFSSGAAPRADAGGDAISDAA
jgi:CBS domain-containing protein